LSGLAGVRRSVAGTRDSAGRGLYRVGVRPRLRRRELGLLLVVGAALLVGWFGLAATQAGSWNVGWPELLMGYLSLLAAIHVAFVVTGRQTDQILLPATAMLGGLSLLLMERLPQNLASQELLGQTLGLADLQSAWLWLSFLLLAAVAIFVRSDGWLRRYKYTWAALGIGLLLLTFLFGRSVGGAILTIRIGPITGQPSELLKVILVIFMAGYLAENRALLSASNMRVGRLRLPPLGYLAPLLAMWGVALAVIIIQRDLGAALLLFLVFLALLYAATRRAIYVVAGLILFVAGSYVLYQVFPHVQDRVAIWLDPWSDPLGSGYQIIRGLFAFGRGGVLGTGLGAGLPQVGAVPSIPAIHTDFPFAALSEELGMLGALAVLGLYLLIAERGFRIAAAAPDEFRALLAAGLTLVIVVQAAVIIGGNLRVMPLTGITLPFISYGGSSLLVNGALVGLLLALSDKGAEPPGRRIGRPPAPAWAAS
jgi:cell division protein FtsW (lipid II flippase)